MIRVGKELSNEVPKLYVIGLGPGDPGLITVMGAEVLRKVKLVFIPYSTSSNRSLAYTIVSKYIGPDTQVVFLGFPMVKEPSKEVLMGNARAICDGLRRYGSAAFVVLGDSSLYSTFYRIKPFIDCDYEPIIVPGVSSIMACAARAGVNLAVGDESIVILVGDDIEGLMRATGFADTIIVLKGSADMGRVASLLRNYEYSVTYARRCYMDGELIINEPSGELPRDYFSLVIARRIYK
ncbi:precorrin-2 C(20)-methyltransferase [Vulcanisaeta souniana JCM 11219]|uniref:Precorrin-2 C(20)-methyltransferase n=2 Tax=Vulcanisaeta souniana TaxID=164452 RepID=A0ABN6SQ03_9CREN|nr:precorrin-2 C(20)-methyltransferase [Vulcanisaeta souniana JCM 11219]